MKGYEPYDHPYFSVDSRKNTAELVIWEHEGGVQTIKRIIPRNIKINVIAKE